jgi:hypothetical protein
MPPTESIVATIGVYTCLKERSGLEAQLSWFGTLNNLV